MSEGTEHVEQETPWVDFTTVERAMARRMQRVAEVPTAHQYVMVDMTAALDKLRRLRDDGWDASVNLIVLAAATHALREVPEIAHEVDLASFRRRAPAHVHVGIAVDSPRGLVVPVVRDVLGRSFEKLAHEYNRVVQAARSGEQSADLFRGGHFTVTNLGKDGVDGGIPLPNVPQIAIMGVSSIRERPVVVSGVVEPRRVARVGLTLDHRALDGATGARFLRAVRASLESAAEGWPELRRDGEPDGTGARPKPTGTPYRLEGLPLDEAGKRLVKGSLERFPQPPNLFHALAHLPAVGAPMVKLGDRLLFSGTLTARCREAVILRTALNAGSPYELAQHRRIGRDCGLTDAELDWLSTDLAPTEPPATLSHTEVVVARAADQVCGSSCRVGDATWDEATSLLGAASVLEVVVLAGFYRLLAGVANTVNLPLDDAPIPFRMDPNDSGGTT